MTGAGFVDLAGDGGRAGASDALAGVSEVLVVGVRGRFRSVRVVLAVVSARLAASGGQVVVAGSGRGRAR